MNIGFVSTWLERGAAYVTKAYIDALKEKNEVFVYARGGEKFAKGDPNWDYPYVTWGYRLDVMEIEKNHFLKWVKKNHLDIVFFNEQHPMDIVHILKHEYPNVITGAYIDYYKENMIDDFNIYDFLICNTKRHYSVFKKHPQCYYIPWGTDIGLFTPKNSENNKSDKITFFHSVGMSTRKGTDILLDVFLNSNLHKRSELVIHSQLDLRRTFNLNEKQISESNIKIIEETVTAPGLYHLGDVYVYPTTLDGLGLTLYEAIACGLPVITTNNAPMNEVISSNNGYLVDVERYTSRNDGYYWPQSYVKKESLFEAMNHYINNKEKLSDYSIQARESAVKNWNWEDRIAKINYVFSNVETLEHEVDIITSYSIQKEKYNKVLKSLFHTLPAWIRHFLMSYYRDVM